MPMTMRNKFHELGNWHHKISLAAIVSKEMLIQNDITQLSKEELKNTVTEVINYLHQIDTFIIGVDKAVEEMKPFIYERIDPEEEIPLPKKEEKTV